MCRGPEHDFKPFLYELQYQICGIQYILEMGKVESEESPSHSVCPSTLQMSWLASGKFTEIQNLAPATDRVWGTLSLGVLIISSDQKLRQQESSWLDFVSVQTHGLYWVMQQTGKRRSVRELDTHPQDTVQSLDALYGRVIGALKAGSVKFR